MIGYISGYTKFINSNDIIVDVNGIGYIVHCKSTFIQNLSINQEIKLFIEQQFKEDGVQLFGFETYLEKELFLILISVQGVGGKMAMNIISYWSCKDLASIILDKRIEDLCIVPGIAKKLSERICSELYSKKTFQKFVNATLMIPVNNKKDNKMEKNNINNSLYDIVDCMKNMGFSQNESYIYVMEACKELEIAVHESINIKEKESEIIKLTLRKLTS